MRQTKYNSLLLLSGNRRLKNLSTAIVKLTARKIKKSLSDTEGLPKEWR